MSGRASTLALSAVLAASVATGSPGAAPVSPPQGTIVFAANRAAKLIQPAVYTIGVDGRGRRRISRSFRFVDSLRWSPGNRWIALKADGRLRLAFGGRRGRVLARNLAPGNPQWSPDGSRLAFLSPEGSLAADLFVLRLGGGPHRVSRKVASGPSWSPDGQSVAYTTNGELWIANLGTGAKRRVRRASWGATDPAWSPDGRHLAFTSDLNDAYGIYSVDLQTGKGRLLARQMRRPLWSPDGTRLAAKSENAVWVLTADGKRARRVLRGNASESIPSWSPDSRRLAVALDEVYVFSAAGRGRSRITRERPRSVLVGREVSWSPDGRRLAYVAQAYDPGDDDLFTASSSGKQVRALTRNWIDEANPDWSPDGTSIAFTQYESRAQFIAVLQPGGRARRIAPGSNPAWSPDGRQIAFDSGGDLYVIAADGSGERLVLDGPTRDSNPDWSPDGRELVFERVPDAGYLPLDLWATALDGSSVRRITDVRRGRDPCTVTSASDPAWSPNGSEIAFALLEAGSVTCNQHGGWKSIYLVPANGSGTQTLVTNGGAYLLGDDGAYAPAWSPDGTRLAFVSDLEKLYGRVAGRRIAVVTRAGGGFRFVTGVGYEASGPNWAP